MDCRRQTYGWLLLLVFVMGSVLAPVLHFGQHAPGEEADYASTGDVVQITLAAGDVDCPQCDAPLLATSLPSPIQTAAMYFDTVLQRAPQRPALDLIGNTSDRGPPACALG